MSLSPVQIKQNKEDTLEILNNTIELPERFYEYLDETDFWTAPASTRFHNAYEGGLVEHSLKVYEHLSMLNYHHLLGFEDRSIAITSLFHDLCKTDFYRKTYKNKKMEDGRWIRVSSYDVQDQFPAGHGNKSVYLLLVHGVELTEDEILAITHHMGAWEAKSYGDEQALSGAMGKYKLVTALHIADMMAVWL